MFEDRINRGMALLDAYEPTWLQKINLAALDLNHESLCVIGQVFGGHTYGDFAQGAMTIGALEPEYRFDGADVVLDAVSFYGFALYEYEEDPDIEFNDEHTGCGPEPYAILTAEWREAIAYRRLLGYVPEPTPTFVGR